MVNPSDYFVVREKEIRDSLTHFMLIHSSIAPRIAEEMACGGPEGDRNFASLDDVGLKMQAYLIECYDRFFFGLQSFLKDVSREQWDKLNKSNDVIIKTIEHSVTFCESSAQALERALAALDEQMKILKVGIEEQKRRTVRTEPMDIRSTLPPHDNEE